MSRWWPSSLTLPCGVEGSGVARLVLENVSKRFGATRAVDGVELDVAEGEFLAVLGPSGCGKIGRASCRERV